MHAQRLWQGFKSNQSLQRHRNVHYNIRVPCGHDLFDKNFSNAVAAARHRNSHAVSALPREAGAPVAGAKHRRDGDDSRGDGSLGAEQDQDNVFNLGVIAT